MSIPHSKDRDIIGRREGDRVSVSILMIIVSSPLSASQLSWVGDLSCTTSAVRSISIAPAALRESLRKIDKYIN